MPTNNKITCNLELALQHLQQGELVAFPTETVYGLGADARNPNAIKKVFQAKGRPVDHPLIVHLASARDLPLWASNIPDLAWQLAEQFWPGPLTMIFAKQPAVSELITGGQNTIAIRVPNHPLTLQLLQQFGSGLVGPSANKYGHVSPTTAEHVAYDLNNEVAVILDGGACNIGIESTVVYLAGSQPMILRQGAITAQQLADCVGVEFVIQDLTAQTPMQNSPGSPLSHYAPRTPVYLVSSQDLDATLQSYVAQNKTCAVLSFQKINNPYCYEAELDPQAYAQALYARLRAMDALNCSALLIEQVPNDPAWAAIADRLMRSSAVK